MASKSEQLQSLLLMEALLESNQEEKLKEIIKTMIDELKKG